MKYISWIYRNGLFLFLFFSQTSCNRICKENTDILTNCRYKYWDIIYYNGYSGLTGAYRFSVDGKCFYLKYFKDAHKRDFFSVDDVHEKNEWRMLGDSVIMIGRHKNKIIKLSDDTLVFIEAVEGKKIVLIPSNDQADLYDFGNLN